MAGMINPFGTETTFVQVSQICLKFSEPCHVGIHLKALSGEYQNARVSVILSIFAILYSEEISHQ